MQDEILMGEFLHMRTLGITILLALLICPFAWAAEKPLGIDEYTSVDELAAAISSYFPKVQGEVKAVHADHLTIALGQKDGVMAGMVLSLWRDGKEILHPVTGMVIGRIEEEVGSMEVTSVGDSSTTGVIRKKIMEPKPGDKARITPKKISLALVPVSAEHPEIAQGLAERLNEYGRFTLLSSEKIAAIMKDTRQRDTSLVREMARGAGVDAVVALGVYPAEGRLLATARVFYAEDAKPLDTIVALLDLKNAKETLAEVKPFFAPVKEDENTTPVLPIDAKLFLTGDFDGKGTDEFVFSDGVRLHIYQLEKKEWHEVWTEAVASADTDIQHINIDAADINSNNRPEIFVTAMKSGRVFSYVVEYKDGVFQRIADIPGFLRVLRGPAGDVALIHQDYDPVTFYAGQPNRFSWLNGKYVSGSQFALPNGLGLYGFVSVGVGEPQPFLVGLDEKDHILVYSRDSLVWKSLDTYAGVDTLVQKPLTGSAAAVSGFDADKGEKARINARILALDINGDKREEIVLPRNLNGMLTGNYTGAELYGMRWNGSRLEQEWSVKNIPGAVLDLHATQKADGAVQVRALVKISGGLFQSDRVMVMTFGRN